MVVGIKHNNLEKVLTCRKEEEEEIEGLDDSSSHNITCLLCYQEKKVTCEALIPLTGLPYPQTS